MTAHIGEEMMDKSCSPELNFELLFTDHNYLRYEVLAEAGMYAI